MKQKMFPR